MGGTPIKPNVFQAKNLVLGVLLTIGLLSVVTWYSYVRVERVQLNLESMNQVHVPALKHLGLLGGKWSAYVRSFEQYISFRRWGKPGFELSANKFNLKSAIIPNLNELRALSNMPAARSQPENEKLQELITSFENMAVDEHILLLELATQVNTKHFAEALQTYSRLRQSHLNASEKLQATNRLIETRISTLQLATEEILRNSQGVALVLLAASLVLALVVLLKIRSWFLPVIEWTKIAQEISLKGIHGGVRFPEITRSMPPEIALLTREFTRMGRTVLERELTIQQQKDKVESLNSRLKEQNDRLLRLGGLNEKVLNSMTAGLLVVVPDPANASRFVVEQYNEQFCQIFGFVARDLHGAVAEAALQAWPELLRQRWLNRTLPLDSFFLRRMKLGQRLFDIRAHELPQKLGRLFLFEDVTQIVHVEERLAHVNKLVLAGNLSSQVSHEVRNPLNSMSLQIEMLEEDVQQVVLNEAHLKPLTQRMKALRDQIERLDRITLRYLDVGRSHSFEHNTAEAQNLELVNVGELIEKCLEFLSAEIQAAGIQVSLKFHSKEVLASGDSDALYQVIFNLIRNSIEALEQKDAGRKEKLLEVQTAVESGVLKVRVRDNGTGVSDGVKRRLFEPFVTNKPSGHGLGLSVSRQICIEHGGELRYVDPSLGTGAVFEFSLPTTVQPQKES